MRIGFVGTGEITSSIVCGMKSLGIKSDSIWLSPRNSVVANRLASGFTDVYVALSNQEVLDRSELVVIAVRPQVAMSVLSQLRFRPEHGVVSLVSALSLRDLTQLVMPADRIVRAVPLPSTALRIGPTAIYPADAATSEIFGKVGSVFTVDSEHQFNAICTATATIATYFAFINQIASWLERQGVPQSKARDYIARLFLGVTTGAIHEPHSSFESLAKAHATSGGINEQFLEHILASALLTGVSDGLDAILERLEASERVGPPHHLQTRDETDREA